ncbi:MAG: ThuA domain-containing protein [Planctomycetes bacterium]|nr:ThuA domain-containing protein [Planctomycetota bacterium]
MAAKKALIVQGGWDGHSPKQCAEIFAGELKKKGYDVVVSDTLASYADKALMDSVDLVVPIWTMGQIKPEEEKGLLDAVTAGTGVAGFHGGMCDSFRGNLGYQMMTGGQWISHPGGLWPEYSVQILDREHPITQGIADFKLKNTERYWLMVNPGVRVLGTIYFEDFGVNMPYIWTNTWGKGKVFYAAWGHSHKDFDGAESREVVTRGMVWATR